MNTGELLEELRESILRDTSTIVAGPQDNLWSDEALMRYMNEAQTLFCRKTLSLVDQTTAEVTEVALVTDQTEYPLHDAVLQVLSARVEGQHQDMVLAGHGLLDSRPQGPLTDDLTFGDPAAAPYYTDCPTVYTTDEDTMTLRVYPGVSSDCAGKTLHLRVARLPISPLSLDDLEGSPEIRDEYHLAMLDWAAYRALSNHDSDAEGVIRARGRKKDFEETCKQVLLDMRRRRFAPTAWNFGAGWTK